MKGVVTTVEVLILILIFLAVAAFFASMYLSATQQAAQSVKQRQIQAIMTLNPPVKIIGVMSSVKLTNVTIDEKAAGNITQPIICVKEEQGKMWWFVGATYKIPGGATIASLNEYDLYSLIYNSWKDLYGSVENLTNVIYHNLTAVICACAKGPISNPQILNMTYINTTSNTRLYLTCDNYDSVISYCKDYCNSTSSDATYVFLAQILEYLPRGRIAAVAGPLVNITWLGEVYGVYTLEARTIWSGQLQPVEVLNAPKEVPSPDRIAFGESFYAGCEDCIFTIS